MKTTKILTLIIAVSLLSACSRTTKPLSDPENTTPDTNIEVSTADDPTWGQDSAPVKLVVFADFECPYCADLHENLGALEELVTLGQVQIQYRDYPISSHLNSLSAHTAASAAHAQGQYLQMQDMLYADQLEWADSAEPERYFAQLAESIGLDMQKYSDDYNDLSARDEIQNDRDEGRNAGVLGTPAFFMNNQIYQGALDGADLVSEVEKFLNSSS